MYTKFVIVCDDDVNARDWNDVIWAITTRMDPVSYTHLDVYKRQANARSMYWANGQAMLTAPLSLTPACCRNFAIASSLPH